MNIVTQKRLWSHVFVRGPRRNQCTHVRKRRTDALVVEQQVNTEPSRAECETGGRVVDSQCDPATGRDNVRSRRTRHGRPRAGRARASGPRPSIADNFSPRRGTTLTASVYRFRLFTTFLAVSPVPRPGVFFSPFPRLPFPFTTVVTDPGL